ncbi:MAG: EAL domain-containing protein [Prochloraceae cyanobacterium]
MQQDGLHLLVVEDVWEDVQLITLTLEQAGINFTYDNAESVFESDELLKRNSYDAVLADYHLPHGNAERVLKLLQESGQEIPLILITGTLGEEAAVKCIKLGMTDYVLKNRLFRLPTVLERALEEFELRRQKQAAIAQLEQQAKREAIVNRIVQVIRETLILEDVLQTTLDQLHEELNLSRCIFLKPVNDYFQVHYVSKHTAKAEQLVGIRCDFCQQYYESLRKGETIVVNEINDSICEIVQQTAEKFEILSATIAPLVYQNSLLGVISLQQCDRQRTWTENELALVKAIADHCAIAIHQADLYQQVQTELREKKRMEAQLRHDAFHDLLTGLPNRALFLERLERALEMTKGKGRSPEDCDCQLLAIVFIDLDGFKVVNDSLGHGAGDRLLQQVARRIESCLRVNDIVARLGGDEFVILLECITDISDASKVANRLHQILASPFILEGQEIFISASIGIALGSPHYEQASQLLRDADIAMYQAKNNGRGCYVIFDNSMHAQALKRLNLENNLRRAIDHQELKVFYQPIISLQTQRIEGFEALVRWQHPEEGLMSPCHFIHVAEETGLICLIDLWVFQQACQQLRSWQEQFPTLLPLTMSINLSGQQFSQGNLIAQLERLIEETQVEQCSIKLEITESILIQNANLATEVLNQLRQRDIEVCLDDFGTGYSSLGYLHRFPIKTLKIDRSFVQDWQPNLENTGIAQAIVNLGLNLGLTVVAEGIETAEQYSFLKAIGCHLGQGYWFNQPLSAEDITKLLSTIRKGNSQEILQN